MKIALMLLLLASSARADIAPDPKPSQRAGAQLAVFLLAAGVIAACALSKRSPAEQ